MEARWSEDAACFVSGCFECGVGEVDIHRALTAVCVLPSLSKKNSRNPTAECVAGDDMVECGTACFVAAGVSLGLVFLIVAVCVYRYTVRAHAEVVAQRRRSSTAALGASSSSGDRRASRTSVSGATAIGLSDDAAHGRTMSASDALPPTTPTDGSDTRLGGGSAEGRQFGEFMTSALAMDEQRRSFRKTRSFVAPKYYKDPLAGIGPLSRTSSTATAHNMRNDDDAAQVDHAPRHTAQQQPALQRKHTSPLDLTDSAGSDSAVSSRAASRASSAASSRASSATSSGRRRRARTVILHSPQGADLQPRGGSGAVVAAPLVLCDDSEAETPSHLSSTAGSSSSNSGGAGTLAVQIDTDDDDNASSPSNVASPLAERTPSAAATVPVTPTPNGTAAARRAPSWAFVRDRDAQPGAKATLPR